MLTRLVFSLVLGLLMYVPRPVPRPPIDTVPPTPDELPPGGDGDGDGVPPIGIPDVDPPGTPIPIPEIEIPDWPSGPGGFLPSVPPTPPPGYEGEWPPASERPQGPKLPPTAPPGHTGPWNPVEGDGPVTGGGDSAFRERVRDIIKDLRELLAENRQGKAVGDAGEGAKKLKPVNLPSEGGTLEA